MKKSKSIKKSIDFDNFGLNSTISDWFGFYFNQNGIFDIIRTDFKQNPCDNVKSDNKFGLKKFIIISDSTPISVKMWL